MARTASTASALAGVASFVKARPLKADGRQLLVDLVPVLDAVCVDAVARGQLPLRRLDRHRLRAGAAEAGPPVELDRAFRAVEGNAARHFGRRELRLAPVAGIADTEAGLTVRVCLPVTRRALRWSSRRAEQRWPLRLAWAQGWAPPARAPRSWNGRTGSRALARRPVTLPGRIGLLAFIVLPSPASVLAASLTGAVLEAPVSLACDRGAASGPRRAPTILRESCARSTSARTPRSSRGARRARLPRSA